MFYYFSISCLKLVIFLLKKKMKKCKVYIEIYNELIKYNKLILKTLLLK